MTDRDALLAAICANPEEDTPRLVYADWLDENGGGKRAAYIRAQIEFHRLEHADTAASVAFQNIETDYRSGAHRERIDWTTVDADLAAVFKAKKEAKKRGMTLTLKGEGLPKLPKVLFTEEARGFYSHVHVEEAGVLVRHASAIFGAAPIARVEIGRLTVEGARELVNAGHLARIRELAVDAEDEPEALRVLGNHRDAAGVCVLIPRGGDNGTAQLEALAAGKYWTGVEEIELYNFDEIDGESAAAADLFRRKPFRNLRRIEAWGNGWRDDVAESVAANLPELRHLDLAINSITGKGAKAIAESRTLTNLRLLDIASCNIHDGSATALINSPRMPNLTVLMLDSNAHQTLNRNVLAKPGRGPGLRVLTLDNFEPSAGSLTALAKCPAIQGLWSLSLESCGLDDDLLQTFLQHANFDRLTRLDLSGNPLAADGLKALAEWPSAANLQWLDLSENELSVRGAKALIASPHLKRLKYLTAEGRGKSNLKAHFKRVFM